MLWIVALLDSVHGVTTTYLTHFTDPITWYLLIGSLAAWSQTYWGNPVARSLRACLQSAAMNGYAAAPVLNTVRGVILSTGGYLVWKDGFGGKGEQEEEGKEEKSR